MCVYACFDSDPTTIINPRSTNLRLPLSLACVTHPLVLYTLLSQMSASQRRRRYEDLPWVGFRGICSASMGASLAMLLPMLIVFGLLPNAVVPVHGAQLLSTVPNLHVLTAGGLGQNMTATFRFSAEEAFTQTTSEFTIVGPNYNSVVKLTPRRVRTPYTVQPKTYVPPHAEVETINIYLRPDSFGVNASAGAGERLLDPAGRKPLAYQAMFQRQLLGLIPLPGKIGDTINCGIEGILNKLTGDSASSECQAPFPSPDELHQWEANETNTFNKLNDFIKNATQTFTDMGATLGTLINSTAVLTDGLNATKTAVQNVLNLATDTSYMLNIFQKQVGQNFTFVQGEIGNLTNSIRSIRDALTQLTLTDGDNFKYLLLDIVNVTSQTNAHFANLTAIINKDRQKAASDKIQLTRYARQISDYLSDAINQKSFKTPSIPTVQNVIQQIQDEGIYQIFLEDLGRAPPDRTTLTRAEGAVVCDVVSISTMWSAPGTGAPMMSVTNYTWWCSKEFLASRVTAGSWYQYMELLGPSNCNQTTFATGRCNSWIEISEQQAQMANGGGPGFVPTPSALLAFKNPALAYIPGNLVQGGAGNIVAGSLDGTVLKGPEDFFDAQTAICQRGSRPDFGFYRITSFGSRMSISQIPYNTAACGTESLQQLLQPDGDDPYTIMYAFVQMELVAYQTAMAQVNVSDALGMHPNYMNWDFNPFFRLALGETSVMKISFAVTSKNADLVEISEINPLPMEVKIDVQVDDGAVITYDGGIYEPSAVATPAPGTFFAGKRFDCWTGAAPLYDAAISEVTPTAWKMSSCGKPTYYGVDDPDSFSRPYWADFNRVEFDAKCGGGSLDIMAESVDFATGRCNLPLQSASNGPWCNYLESFKVEPDSIHEILYFVHRTTQPEVSVIIPQGSVVALLNSACPGVQELKTSVLYKNYMLTNPLNSPNTIRVVKSGACAGSEDVPMDPLATIPYSIPVCPGGGVTIVTFQVLNQDDEVTATCPITLNATIIPAESGLQPAPASFNLTEIQRLLTASSLVMLAKYNAQQTSLMINQALLGMFQLITSAGITIPVTALENYTATTNIIDQITNDINDLANTEQGAQFNYDGEFANYTALSEQQAAAAQAAIDQTQADVNQLVQNQATLGADLNKINSDIADLKQSAAAFINASDALINLLQFLQTQNPSTIPSAQCDDSIIFKFFCNIPDDVDGFAKKLSGLISNPFDNLFGGLGSGVLAFIQLIMLIGSYVWIAILQKRDVNRSREIESLKKQKGSGPGPAAYVPPAVAAAAQYVVPAVAAVASTTPMGKVASAVASSAASRAIDALKPLPTPPPLSAPGGFGSIRARTSRDSDTDQREEASLSFASFAEERVKHAQPFVPDE